MPKNGEPSALMLLLPLFLRLIPATETDTGKLPSPQGVFIESTNMRHLLKWRPLQVPCHPVSYSVQYQGYFELFIKNGSWEDAPYCQKVDGAACDLTVGFGSDSDYNVRVKAECGGRVSDWTRLGTPFNRRETNLTAPKMKATVSGDSIHVVFADLTEMVDVTLKHWREGLEKEASIQHIMVERNPFHLGGLEEGATYCLSAQTVLHDRRSASTEPQCFSIAVSPESARGWLKPTVACVAVVIVAGVGLAAFWSVTRCYPALLNTCWPQEPLPDVLVSTAPTHTRVWMFSQEGDEGECYVPELRREANTRLRVLPEEEIHELCQPVLVLLPDPV